MKAVGELVLLCSELNGRGGIQRFNRNLLAASVGAATSIVVISVHDAVGATAPTAAAHVSLRGCGGNRLRFLLALGLRLLFGRCDVLLVGHVNFMTVVAMLLALRPRARPRTLMVAHGIDVWQGIRGLRRWSLRACARILCVSEYTKRRIVEQAPELADDRFVHFPNALDAAWRVRAEAAARADRAAAPFILSVGRLDREDRTKGIVTTMEALAGLPHPGVDYVVAGHGNDIDWLQRVATRLGIAPRVRFVGPIGDTQLAELYRDCWAFVLPSGQEGFGIVYLEAMCQGAPVIAARAKGAIDVVEHELSGLLVDYGDVAGLRQTIARLLGDELLGRRLARNARGLVGEGGAFTFEAFRRRWRLVLENVQT